MKAVRTLKGQAGFSLIELMIVVAIIGILATVAIPNFTRFQARARQANAKAILSSYATAQKATYSEFQYMPGRFAASGFKPEGSLVYALNGASNGTVTQAAAFADAIGNKADTAATDACVATGSSATARDGECASLGAYQITAYAIDPPAATAPTGGVGTPEAAFVATAAANIGGTVGDTWSWTAATGVIVNVTSGLP